MASLGVAGELFNVLAGIDMTHVAYRRSVPAPIADTAATWMPRAIVNASVRFWALGRKGRGVESL